ncbi:MAG TPA: hypothetical protein PLV68_15660, partial [Ilumatobacteraceae bacterium]|nr:hypothetical protein [Ilumatobacteraceae bacterium]
AAVAVEIAADPAGHPVALVFKTVVDQFLGNLSMVKVVSGTIANEARLVNSATGADERVHGLYRVRGRDHQPVQALHAGEIGAIAKLTDSPTGTTLSGPGQPVHVAWLSPPAPNYALALEPLTQADDDKLTVALTRAVAEDPSLAIERSDETHQTVLAGRGDMHLTVTLERLSRKFGVNVSTADVAIAYRETISAGAGAQGKVKKQSGGHGQFAVCDLRVTPTQRGTGSSFVDSVVGGAIPRQYLPAVERGAFEAMEAAGPLGFPVVDVRVECHDGKVHSVDSSEMAFRAAAGAGVREALSKAGPVLLEPVSHVTITVPETQQGDVLGDLSARRGRVVGSAALDDGLHEISALV